MSSPLDRYDSPSAVVPRRFPVDPRAPDVVPGWLWDFFRRDNPFDALLSAPRPDWPGRVVVPRFDRSPDVPARARS